MSHDLWVLLGVFIGAALLGAPLGLAMLASGFAYLISSRQDLGLVTDQTMNGLYNSYLLLAIPLTLLFFGSIGLVKMVEPKALQGPHE